MQNGGPSLWVYSIFKSFDGEVNYWGQGRQSVFIRLSGCNLACPYCDAAYARDKEAGEQLTIYQVMHRVQVAAQGATKVTITGGEPLLQQEALDPLMAGLVQKGYDISIETNGTIIPTLGQFPDTGIVMDYKLDQPHQMNLLAFKALRHWDESIVKMVVGDKEEFDRALVAMDEIDPKGLLRFAVGVKWGILANGILAEWVLESGKDILLNTQLHKLIGLRESK